MQKILVLTLGSALLAACGGQDEPSTPVVDEAALREQATTIAGQFVGTLLPTLQQAMQQGGPVNAIDVCAEQAPLIAQRLSAESGWQVRRVSLKARNSTNATPDVWEAQVLQSFDQRQLSGEPGAQINQAEMVDGEFRYMQAQPAGPLCLTCHGTELSAEVANALAQHYPGDLATGYLEGQIRGAISLRIQP